MVDIKYYRKCKNVDRLSTSIKHRQYNLLEHQYMVAILFKRFANIEEVPYGMTEFDIILNHDILEAETQDLLYPIKNLNSTTKEAWEIIEKEVIEVHFQLEPYSDQNIKRGLNQRQHALFKAMDYLDLWIFVKEEIALGNRTSAILAVQQNCVQLIREICNKNGFSHIKKFMDNYEV